MRATLAERWPKAAALTDTAKPEVLAFAAFPVEHWRKIWSTNPLEWVNKEIKRRSRVVGIFPNEASVIRLVGAVLADLHDDWISSDRRYLSEGSMAKLYPDRVGAPPVAAELNTGDWPTPSITLEPPPLRGPLPRGHAAAPRTRRAVGGVSAGAGHARSREKAHGRGRHGDHLGDGVHDPPGGTDLPRMQVSSVVSL